MLVNYNFEINNRMESIKIRRLNRQITLGNAGHDAYQPNW